MKILSLDGGGTWALIQARALGALYGDDTPGHDILRRFDLAAANSGGSIVLGALAADYTPRKIASVFREKVNSIFVPRAGGSFWRWLAHFVELDAPWSTELKLHGLQAALAPLGTRTLPQVKADSPGLPDFLISAYDYDRRRVRFFRSDLKSLAGSQDPPSLVPSFVEAIHASSTAPIMFFDQPAVLSPADRFWDGAVAGFNNPVLAAVLELRANHPQGAIHALSLGTGQVRLPLAEGTRTAEWPSLLESPAEPCLPHDLKEMAMCILDNPPDAASFDAHVILGGRLPGAGDPPVEDGPVVRLNPLVQPWLDPTGKIWTRMLPRELDSTFECLVKLKMDATTSKEIGAIGVLCDAWLSGRAPNQPIRASRDLQVEIGHRRFGDARGRLQALGLV